MLNVETPPACCIRRRSRYNRTRGGPTLEATQRPLLTMAGGHRRGVAERGDSLLQASKHGSAAHSIPHEVAIEVWQWRQTDGKERTSSDLIESLRRCDGVLEDRLPA